MRRDLKNIVREELAELAQLRGVVDGIEKDYENAKAVAKAMADAIPR